MRKRKLIEAICECCGKKYTSNSNNQKFCSKECRMTAMNNKQEVKKAKSFICVGCGKIFTPNFGHQKFCSADCRKENWKKKQAKKEQYPIKKTCICCGNEFIAKHHKALYCSLKCKYKIYGESSYVGTDKEISVGGQICWHCKNACGGCSWSRSLTPVNGWIAEPLELLGGVQSYKIHYCPDFERG